MYKVIWHPKAKKEVRSFPEDVKDKLGYLIFRLQMGVTLGMPYSRNMPLVGKGVKELHVKGEDGTYRSFYFKIDRENIAIFHAFKKKTQKTSSQNMEQGKKNFKEVIKWHNQR